MNKRVKRPTKKTVAQILLGEHLRELGFTGIQMEYRFIPERRFRFDLAIPNKNLAFEVDGGSGYYRDHEGIVHMGAGHRRGAAWEDQYEKANLAAAFGWKLLTFSNEMVNDLRAKEFVRNWFVER